MPPGCSSALPVALGHGRPAASRSSLGTRSGSTWKGHPPRSFATADKVSSCTTASARSARRERSAPAARFKSSQASSPAQTNLTPSSHVAWSSVTLWLCGSDPVLLCLFCFNCLPRLRRCRTLPWRFSRNLRQWPRRAKHRLHRLPLGRNLPDPRKSLRTSASASRIGTHIHVIHVHLLLVVVMHVCAGQCLYVIQLLPCCSFGSSRSGGGTSLSSMLLVSRLLSRSADALPSRP